MEQQFQIKTAEYVDRLRTAGIGLILVWGITNVGVNMTWNLRAFEGIDTVTSGRIRLLYLMLLLYFVLSWYILDFIIIRSKKVLSLKAEVQKYKLTFMFEGVHIHIPCSEESVMIPYMDIRRWGFQDTKNGLSTTFFIDTRKHGRISVYFGKETKPSIHEACLKYAPDLRITPKIEHLASFLLTVFEVTEAKEVKTTVKQRSKA